MTSLFLFLLLVAFSGQSVTNVLPANQWVELQKDPVGARRGSAIRYVPDLDAFLLWGFMNADPDLLQEHPLMEVPEYDVVAFNLEDRRWHSHLPKEWEKDWATKLPLAYVPRTYSGITTGSERTLLRGPTSESFGAARPDLNIVFDQVTYMPSKKWLVYFTGGLTAAYDVLDRRWTDLSPTHKPPPVLGGSLAYDSLNDEIVLFGGGHVAEWSPQGELAGYTGTWFYRFSDQDWHRLENPVQPPPRMNMRMVCDTRNQVLVLFGGDGQSHYLADTWLYDLKTRTWRKSRAAKGPAARAGHFTIYDPQTGWVIIGGGYNRQDLTDMWAYDAAADRWQRLLGQVPTGFYISADIAAQSRVIVLTTNTRKPGDTMSCNILYPVRTTYGYRIQEDTGLAGGPAEALASIPKRDPDENKLDNQSEETRRAAQLKRLREMPTNRWIALANPARSAPSRTWGSATFDSERGLILYWGGGHCGYEGSDVDAYDVAAHIWRSRDAAPEYPERAWNHGVRLAGVTFRGKPWTDHGRRIYAYDSVSRKMIMVRPIRLTEGYDPEPLKQLPAVRHAARDALVNPPSSYVKYVTWTYDPDTSTWEFIGGAPDGLDTLVTTRHGVMGVNVHWPARLNDAGYLLPWSPSQPPEDKAIFLLNVLTKRWERLSSGPGPQNLYEMTSLAYDSKRDRVVLHGGGERRDELWTFEMANRRWKNMKPQVKGSNAQPPVCMREAVYIPGEDVVLTYGSSSDDRAHLSAWIYHPDENSWTRADLSGLSPTERRQAAGQNRAMVYDPKHDLVLLVLGSSGDRGKASVYALRYRNPM